MSKAGTWKGLFGHKEKVLVDIGGELQEMTDTQSYRFGELEKSRRERELPAQQNPLDEARYSLKSAAFRLMTSEDDVLEKAIAGRFRVYVDASGLSGHWRRRDSEGNVSQSGLATIRDGLLRLRHRSLVEVKEKGRATVKALDYCEIAADTDQRLDPETLDNLHAWGPGDKQFFLTEPTIVDRGQLLLLPPLT